MADIDPVRYRRSGNRVRRYALSELRTAIATVKGTSNSLASRLISMSAVMTALADGVNGADGAAVAVLSAARKSARFTAGERGRTGRDSSAVTQDASG